jgi:hypothetical protein
MTRVEISKCCTKKSYFNCMNRNCQIPSLCIVCLSHCMAIGRFEEIRIYILPDVRPFDTKVWNSYYTSGGSNACNRVTPPIILEGLNYKIYIYGNFKHLIACYYMCSFVCLFLFWSGSRSNKLLMLVDTKLKSGVFHLITAEHECTKVRIYFWASECILNEFLSVFWSLLVFCLQLKTNSSSGFRGQFELAK